MHHPKGVFHGRPLECPPSAARAGGTLVPAAVHRTRGRHASTWFPAPRQETRMSSVCCVALLLVASCDALVPAAVHRTLPPCVLRPLVARPARVSELRASAGVEEPEWRIQTKTAGRRKAFGLCLLNRATFPSDVPRWRELPRSWFSLQRRLRVNHVLVATTQNGKVVGSIEVHTPQYQQKQAKGVYTPEQLDLNGTPRCR